MKIMIKDVPDYLNLARDAANALDMRPLFNRVMRDNPSADLPYHGNLHTKLMAGTAAWLCVREGGTLQEVATCLAAGLLHDYNHTGHGPDVENIALALTELCHQYTLNMHLFGCANGRLLDINVIHKAILCTQYDGPDKGFPYDPETLVEYCLRDADLWTPHYPNLLGIHMNVGLGTELGLWDAKNYRDKLDAQKQFFAKQRWFTHVGDTLAKWIPERINRWAFPYTEQEWANMDTDLVEAGKTVFSKFQTGPKNTL